MKKTVIILLVTLMILPLCLTSCKGSDKSEQGISVMCTFFPQYDWAKNIIGDAKGVELSLLVENGMDIHSYQPSVRDLARIASCDLFIYVGGESEEWVSEVIETTVSKDTVVISLLDILGDGACHIPESESGDDDPNTSHDHGNECAYDEHVWLSLKNARLFCDKITEALCDLDPENAELYASNNGTYGAALDQLDEKYQSVAESSANKTLLFADRFPFVYLTRDYGISYIAAFAGCSAETEASFATLARLSAAIGEHSLDCVIILEGSEKKLAQTVISSSENKECQILTMNSIQSVTRAEADGGASYLGIMEENLKALESALG